MAALCESLGATSALLELGAVGYSHFLCSFPYVLVDSSLALYGRLVWAAIHLLHRRRDLRTMNINNVDNN